MRSVRWAIAPFVGASIWLLGTYWRLRRVSGHWWEARDDAVITLSHAKNAADHGTIGVSPGGDRVEGFSSPLQFLAAYVVQLVRSIDYRTLSTILYAVPIAVAGALVVVGLRALARELGWSPGAAEALALVLSTATIGITLASWTATGWIGSGMENPMVVCAGATIAGGTWLLGSRPTVGAVLLTAGLAALGLSRVELLALMLPVLAAAAAFVWERHPASLRAAVLVVGVPLTVIGGVHVGRRLYFGEWLPNTAVVQDRSTGRWEVVVIALVAAAFLGMLARQLAVRHMGSGEPRRAAVLAGSAAGWVAAVVLVWASATGRSSGALSQMALLAPLVSAVLVVVLLILVGRFVGVVEDTSLYVLAGLSLVPIGQYLATGEARLDPYRVLGIVVPFGALMICSQVLRVASAVQQRRRAGIATSPLTVSVLTVTAVLAAGAFAWSTSNDGSRPLNYEIGWAGEIVDVVEAVRDDDLGGDGLPILANPDLGKVSYSKTAVMVDLGLLGDPLLTLVQQRDHEATTRYLLDVASPDVVNTQRGWSCSFGDWLGSAEFASTYSIHTIRETTGSEVCPERGAFVIWRRTDGGREYELTRSLLTSPDPAAVATEAIVGCADENDEPFRCQWVRRSAQRAAEVLRSQGSMGDVVRAFEASPSAALDQPMLERGPGWAEQAYAAFAELHER